MPPHRKQVRHYHEPGDLHELTFSTYQRRPLLTNDPWRQMLSTSINRALEGHRFLLVAFVYMPEHVHLLVCPTEPQPELSGFLKAVKQPFSFRIEQQLQANNRSLLDWLTVRARPGVTCFRLWQ
jgi:putative transposase